MSSRLIEIFEDTKLVNRIKNKLPYLFQLAVLESSRAGKIASAIFKSMDELGLVKREFGWQICYIKSTEQRREVLNNDK